jgi:hypothetical protein
VICVFPLGNPRFPKDNWQLPFAILHLSKGFSGLAKDIWHFPTDISRFPTDIFGLAKDISGSAKGFWHFPNDILRLEKDFWRSAKGISRLSKGILGLPEGKTGCQVKKTRFLRFFACEGAKRPLFLASKN